MTVGELPPLHADRAALEQVLANLIDNAIKYRDPARPLQLAVEGRRCGERIEVSVSDTGRGIAAADRARAFQLFRRVGPQTTAGEGVGLAYVQALTRAMGGVIKLESEVGVGSRFTVVLPVGGAAA